MDAAAIARRLGTIRAYFDESVMTRPRNAREPITVIAALIPIDNFAGHLILCTLTYTSSTVDFVFSVDGRLTPSQRLAQWTISKGDP